MPGQPLADPKMQRLLNLRSGKGRHSPLYLWMRDNREALAADFTRNGPQWAERAKLMGEAGLLDGMGKPPTVRGAMQTWYRVCQDTKGTELTPAAVAAQSLPPVPRETAPSSPRSPKPAPIADTDNPYGFRTAGGVKDWTKKGPE